MTCFGQGRSSECPSASQYSVRQVPHGWGSVSGTPSSPATHARESTYDNVD